MFQSEKLLWRGVVTMRTLSDNILRENAHQWIVSQPYLFDTAVCLHLPRKYKFDNHAWDEISLTSNIRHFLNRVDRSILGAGYRHKKQKVPRVVTQEHAVGCGWHAHALFSAHAIGWTTATFVDRLKSIWECEFLKGYRGGKFEDRLFYAEPVHGDYAGYIIKSLSTSDWPLAGQIDAENCWPHVGAS